MVGAEADTDADAGICICIFVLVLLLSTVLVPFFCCHYCVNRLHGLSY